MATYLTIVNSILTKLREPTVSTVSANALSLLVGSFLNDAKREIEDAWQWTHLQDQFTAAFTIANVGAVKWNAQTLAGTGAAPNERAIVWQNLNTNDFLVRLNDSGVVNLLRQTQLGNRELFVALQTYANQGFKARPYNFYVTTNSAGVTAGVSTKVITCFPNPDLTYNFTVVVKNPKNDLVLDTDNMLVPTAPVQMRAYLYCLYERGEELGEALTLTSAKADEALTDAIAFDTAAQGELQLQSE